MLGIIVLYGDDGFFLICLVFLVFYCGCIVYCFLWSIVNLKLFGFIVIFFKN